MKIKRVGTLTSQLLFHRGTALVFIHGGRGNPLIEWLSVTSAYDTGPGSHRLPGAVLDQGVGRVPLFLYPLWR